MFFRKLYRIMIFLYVKAPPWDEPTRCEISFHSRNLLPYPDQDLLQVNTKLSCHSLKASRHWKLKHTILTLLLRQQAWQWFPRQFNDVQMTRTCALWADITWCICRTLETQMLCDLPLQDFVWNWLWRKHSWLWNWLLHSQSCSLAIDCKSSVQHILIRSCLTHDRKRAKSEPNFRPLWEKSNEVL